MATAFKNLSDYNRDEIPNGADFKIGIVVSEWNYNITGNLLKGAVETLTENGVSIENITVKHVPGTYELALGAQLLAAATDVDGIITVGSVVQGETKHFDFVCEAAAQGIKDVSLNHNLPVIFCVLTDNTMEQAIDRSGGKHGNKGVEAAVACIKMIELQNQLSG